jgi:DNA polymerase III sliding clamp (beta) subunit (PCNA family)
MIRGTINTDCLKSWIKPVIIFFDHARLQNQPDSLELYAVKQSRVGWVTASLSKSAFDSLTTSSNSMILPIETLFSILSLLEGKSQITIDILDEANQMHLYSDDLKYRETLDRHFRFPQIYDYPELNNPAEVCLSGDSLNRGVSSALNISSHIELKIDKDGLQIFAKDDLTEVQGTYGNSRTGAQYNNSFTLFDLPLFNLIQQTIPDEVTVKLSLGKEGPLLVEYPIAGGKGTVEIVQKKSVRRKY